MSFYVTLLVTCFDSFLQKKKVFYNAKKMVRADSSFSGQDSKPTPPQKRQITSNHVPYTTITSPHPLLFTMPYPVLRKISDANGKMGMHHSPPPKLRKIDNYSPPTSPTTPLYSPGTPALTPPYNKEPILEDTLHGYALNTDPTQNGLFDEQTASIMCSHSN